MTFCLFFLMRLALLFGIISHQVFLTTWSLSLLITLVINLVVLQIVRADLKELNDMDLHGAPYAYTPFCDSRKEMDGFRYDMNRNAINNIFTIDKCIFSIFSSFWYDQKRKGEVKFYSRPSLCFCGTVITLRNFRNYPLCLGDEGMVWAR